jgi:hypothetical protein
MRSALRIAAFVAVLALVFAGAAVAGGAIDPDTDDRAGDEPMTTAGHEETETAGHEETEAAGHPVRGLAVEDDGLRVVVDDPELRRGRTERLRFRVLGQRGETVRDFDVEHERRMHLIVVRRDLTGFQHLHPEQGEDGTWTTELRLDEAGSYRVFADFSSRGKTYTLADDVSVDGDVRSRPLPEPAKSADVDGFKVRMTDDLAFSITRAGRPVTPEPYLGAKGHLVALREGDLAFLHVHPDENRLRFEADLPPGARYRLFLQFQVDGRVHTAEVTR